MHRLSALFLTALISVAPGAAAGEPPNVPPFNPFTDGEPNLAFPYAATGQLCTEPERESANTGNGEDRRETAFQRHLDTITDAGQKEKVERLAHTILEALPIDIKYGIYCYGGMQYSLERIDTDKDIYTKDPYLSIVISDVLKKTARTGKFTAPEYFSLVRFFLRNKLGEPGSQISPHASAVLARIGLAPTPKNAQLIDYFMKDSPRSNAPGLGQ